MKPIQTASKFLTVIALIALAVGCASNNLLDKENVAVAAGFKVITPKTPAHEALLHKLPPDRVTQINYGGKVYYVLPDAVNDQAYVGGPKQYQSYQQLRRKQKLDSEGSAPPSNLEVVEVNSMDWSGWGGWDTVGGMDGMGFPGWY